jgi:hypothetical protein
MFRSFPKFYMPPSRHNNVASGFVIVSFVGSSMLWLTREARASGPQCGNSGQLPHSTPPAAAEQGIQLLLLK